MLFVLQRIVSSLLLFARLKKLVLHAPQAEQKMVFGRFHVMQHVGKGVARVRKQEQKPCSTKATTRSLAPRSADLPRRHPRAADAGRFTSTSPAIAGRVKSPDPQ